MEAQPLNSLPNSSCDSSRRWRWIVTACCIAATAWFGWFAYLRINLRPTPRPEYWTAKILALDPPGPGAVDEKTRDRVLSHRPWETTAEWSALKYDETSILYGPWDTSRTDIQTVDTVFRSAEFAASYAEFSKMVEAGWQEPVQASTSFSIGAFTNERPWAKTIVAHSRWAREMHGDIDQALSDWRNVLQMSRQIRRLRMLISELVATSCDVLVANEIIVAALEPHDRIEPRAIVELMNSMYPAAIEPMTPFDGERYYTQSLLEHIYISEGGNWLDVTAAASPFVPGPPVSRIWNLLSPLFHDLPTARAVLDMPCTIQPRCTSIHMCAVMDAEVEKSNHRCAMDELDGMRQYFSIAGHFRILHIRYVGRTQLEAALTMLALAEYQRNHGQFPPSLDALLPTYLPRLPIDYGDRGTLRYQRDGEKYILYSVGKNGRDDGGRYVDIPLRFDNTDLDVVFSAASRPAVIP